MEETLNESIIESTSVSSAEAENGESSFASSEAGGFGGGVLGDPLAPDEGYEYDFGEDSGLPMQTPFDQLLEFEEFDNLGDIFGDLDPSDNPFAGGAVPEDVPPPSSDGDTAPAGDPGGDSPPEDNSNNPFDSFNPNTNGSPFTDSDDDEYETTEGVEEMSSGGGSMMNTDFSGIDTGAGNTDNGNGNNFLGDSKGESGSNNQAEGNGNWFYGNDNQAEGNGNWSFGDGNQTEGNGNWNLNEESGTPFDSIFEGENNPLTGGNPLGVGEEGGIPADAIDGNNPVFAGGSTTPTPVGEGETPDTAKNPTGNQNTVNGNGNWNFGSDNNTSGNGNWNFGEDNVVTDGNGNWNLGDNNEVSGNGNRPSGNDNSISGNSNRVTGDGNSINGNRFNLDEDNSNILGNGDRYFQTDTDGNISLVSDESKSDPNYDFDGVVEASADSELSGNDDLAGQDVIDQVYGSLNSDGADSLSDSGALSSDSAGGNPFGGGAGGQMSSGSFGGGAPNSDSAGGNPFGGGAGGQMSSGNFGGGAPNSDSVGGNPFGGGAGGQMSSDDLNELLAASPFGPLLDIPGVDGAEDIFGNVFGGGAGGFGGGTPSENDGVPVMGDSEGGASTGNPFADGGAGGFSNGQMVEGNLDGSATSGGDIGGFSGDAPSENDGLLVMSGFSEDASNGNPSANFNVLVVGDKPNVSFDNAGGSDDGADQNTTDKDSTYKKDSSFEDHQQEDDKHFGGDAPVMDDSEASTGGFDDGADQSTADKDSTDKKDSSFEDHQQEDDKHSGGDAPVMDDSEDSTSGFGDGVSSGYSFSNFNLFVVGDEPNVSFDDVSGFGGGQMSGGSFGGGAPFGGDAQSENNSLPVIDDSKASAGGFGDGADQSTTDAESKYIYDFSSFKDAQQDSGNPFGDDTSSENKDTLAMNNFGGGQMGEGGFSGGGQMSGGSFGGGAPSSDSAGGNSFSGGAGGFGGGQMSGGSFGGGAPSSDSAGGNPFSGGAGGFGGGQMGGGSFGGGVPSSDSTGGNPFSGGADGFGGGQMGGGNPFSGGAGGFGGGQMGGGSFGGGVPSSDSTGGLDGGADQSNSDVNSPYTYDFSSFEDAQQDSGAASGDGAGGFGGGQMGGGNPFSGGAGGFGGGQQSGGAPSSDSTDGFGGGQQSGGDLNELLASSPFGRLLDIPGVDGAEDIFGNVGGGASGFGGGAPSGGGAGGFGSGAPSENDSVPVMGGSEGGAPSGNPFANFNPLEDGNPFVEGDEPDVSFGGAGDSAGGNPLGDGAGGFGGGAPSGVPNEGSFAIGDADGYLTRDENGEWFISDDDVASKDDTSLTNPEIPGVDSEASGNPFGGNPSEYNPLADAPESSDITETEEMKGEMPEEIKGEIPEEMKGEMPEEMSDLSGDMLEVGGAPSTYSWNFGDSEGASYAGGEDIPVQLNDNGELEISGFGNVNLFNEDGDTDPLLSSFAEAGGSGFGNENFSIPGSGEDGEQAPGIEAIQFEDGKLQIPGIGEIEVFDSEGNYALGVGNFGGPQLGEDGGLQFDGMEIPMDSIASDEVGV